MVALRKIRSSESVPTLIEGSGQNQTVNLYGAGVGGTMIDAYVSDFYCSIQAVPSQPANVTPAISNVAPSPIVVGTSGAMGIGGSGFSSVTGTISVNISGTGVTVSNATSSGDTIINATYTAVSGAATGPRNIYVSWATADGTVSTNSLSITVSANAPVPAKAAIDTNNKQTYTNQSWISCDGQNSMSNAYGYQRCLTYQIEDSSGAPIYENFSVQEAVATVYSNITATVGTGNNVSNPTGQFSDELILVQSSQLPANACRLSKQAITVTGNPNPIRVNCLQFLQNDVTINDVTANPALCTTTTYKCP